MNPILRLAVPFVTVLCIVAAAPAAAHHGGTDHDTDRQMTLTSRVEAGNGENSHPTIVLVSSGHEDRVVLAPVSRMVAREASRRSVAVGRDVTVVGYPDRTRPDEVRAERIAIVEDVTERTVALR